MRRLAYILFLVALLPRRGATQSLSPLTIDHLTCEFKSSPKAIDQPNPRLAWQLQTRDTTLKDQSQTAWQIIVATAPGLLAASTADCWSSGKRTGSLNTNIAYEGKPLQSGHTYYWKVRCWDQQGRATSWSSPASWTMAILQGADWQAAWIGDSKAPIRQDSLLFGDNPAPLFRKTFTPLRKIKKAVLYISGLGYYEAFINGRKIGDHFLDPGWTDYRKTIPYNTFDVTGMLRSGPNCLGVQLGNGWYNTLPLRLWGRLNLREYLATGTPRFIAQLVVSYTDGTTNTIVSDESWKVTDGPLIRNNNYIGCTYDARREKRGWNTPEFNDKDWRDVTITTSPGGELIAQQSPPVCSGPTITPKNIRLLAPHKYLVDLGRNFGGIIRLMAKGPNGTTIHLRYGELLNPDGSLNVLTSVAGQIKKNRAGNPTSPGGPGSPDTAWQQDDLILDGGRVTTFQPTFTFHGFRYVEVDGYPGILTSKLIQGIPLHAELSPAGSFTCSDPLFNTLQAACINTFLSNVFSVQSDCPHREKLGYGGDIVATSEAFMANFDMHDFYAKTVRDYADEAQPDGAMPETAPYVGISDDGLTPTAGPIGWGTVFPLLLYQQYQYYGDKALILRNYDRATVWIDFIDTHAKDHIVQPGIGDHESLDPKQTELTGTAFFYYNVRLLQKLAIILGRKEDSTRYEPLAQSIKEAFLKKFYDPSTGFAGIHTEATQAFALYFHLLPPGEETMALKVLASQILEKNKGHISTGIFGTKYMLEVLSQYGLSDLACSIISQKDFPGWGYMLGKGATTLWEHWAYSDNVYSHNHPMFGSVSGWFYKYLAGIRPDTGAVAYNRIIFQPGGLGRLQFAKASYTSPQGKISAAWRIGHNTFFYDIVVPVNCTATVYLPGRSAGGGGWTIRHTGSGVYHFTVGPEARP